jgi:hypothetical protein
MIALFEHCRRHRPSDGVANVRRRTAINLESRDVVCHPSRHRQRGAREPTSALCSVKSWLSRLFLKFTSNGGGSEKLVKKHCESSITLGMGQPSSASFGPGRRFRTMMRMDVGALRSLGFSFFKRRQFKTRRQTSRNDAPLVELLRRWDESLPNAASLAPRPVQKNGPRRRRSDYCSSGGE